MAYLADMNSAGVWSPLASITLVRTVSFSIYQKSKYALDDIIYRTTGSSPLVIANTKDALPTISTVICFGLAGATAGAFITAIACKKLGDTIELVRHEMADTIILRSL